MKRIISKPLGELLIESKMIQPHHLEEALKLQQEKGGLIGNILVALGHTTEEAIALALTTQYGLPYLSLSGYEIDPEVAKIIPEDMARRNEVIAIDMIGPILTIAMSNPLNVKAVEEVELVTGLKTQIFVATASDLKQTIDRSYKASP